MTENDDGLKKLTLGTVGRWIGGVGVLTLAGAVVLYQNFHKNRVDIYERERIQQQRYDEQVAADAVALTAAKRTAEQARIGAEFADCWPRGNCPDYQQLPVDGEQNSSIEELQSQSERQLRWQKQHCMAHRDAEEKWHDCSEL